VADRVVRDDASGLRAGGSVTVRVLADRVEPKQIEEEET